MNLISLVGNRVKFALLNWENGKYIPAAYTATVQGVDGTMVLMGNQKSFPTGEAVKKDTWVNTASQLFIYIQPI